MSSINHKLKSIFIHVAKCGGSSLSSFDWNKGCGHSTYYNYSKKVKDMSNYFVWSFVRNPWERAASAYEDAIKIHKEVSSFSKYIDILYKNKNVLNSEVYFSYPFDLKIPEIPISLIHFWPMLPCLKNQDGEIGVDFIGRLENIEEDFWFVCRKLNIDKPSIPHENTRLAKQGRKNTFYKDLYNDSLVNKVGEIYQEDINFFKYSFG